MSFTTVPCARAAAPQDHPLTMARTFCHEHRENLINAAQVLGGERGVSLVLSFVDALRGARTMTGGLRKQLVALHRLLNLDAVGDPEAEETASFAEIDILSAEVDDICRLTDAYREMLVEIDRLAAVSAEGEGDSPREAA